MNRPLIENVIVLLLLWVVAICLYVAAANGALP